MTRLLLVVLALASCARENETCSQLTPCPAGGYQFCKSGATCAYHLTDGTQVSCANCADCVAAIALVDQWCDPTTRPGDLGGQGQADLAAPPPLAIPKSSIYTGPKSDPMLNQASQCADAALEPNDQRSPLVFTPVPDMPTPKIVKLAICPAGASDTDWFKVDLTQALYLTAEIFYDVTFGDLDVAIVGAEGQIIAADGSAVSDGCIAAQVGPGTVYVVITGANNVEVNNYSLLIKSYTAPHTCP